MGAFIPGPASVLNALAHHFDGTRWTAFPLPNVGAQQNILQAVSMPSPGKAWAVGDFINGRFQQQTLIEHFDGTVWSVVPSPSPDALQNILYGVAAITDTRYRSQQLRVIVSEYAHSTVVLVACGSSRSTCPVLGNSPPG